MTSDVADRVMEMSDVRLSENDNVSESEKVCVADSVWSPVNVFVADRSGVPDSV